jgi:hypothetical protein
MPCQPILFGRGLCVSTASRTQRRSAFANCERKFNEAGRNLAEVVEYTSDPELSSQADELFQLVDKICTSGAQASTPMCRNLKKRVEEIKTLKVPATSKVEVPKASPRLAMTVAAEEASKVNDVVESLNAKTSCESCDAQRAQTVDEPERAPLSPFPRIESGYDYGACGTQVSKGPFSEKFISDCKLGSEKVPAGFVFRNGPGNPYTSVASPYPDGGPVSRTIEVSSRNNAFNETMLYLEDLAGGPDSHDVKSYMLIIPRKTVPSVRVEGESIITTLPTGETFTMNKDTRAITGGALSEGPMSLTTDRFARKPPNVNYVGAGISIRLDHRYEHPLTSSPTATIKQGSKSCTIQRTALFNNDGKLMTTTDASLLAVLNQNCRGGGFTLP